MYQNKSQWLFYKHCRKLKKYRTHKLQPLFSSSRILILLYTVKSKKASCVDCDQAAQNALLHQGTIHTCNILWVGLVPPPLFFTGKQNFNCFYLIAIHYNIYNFMLSNVKTCTGKRSHLTTSARHEIFVNHPSSP